MKYQLKNDLTGSVCAVLYVERNLVIPFDPANTDYQQYLKWLEEGNQPLPAEEQMK